MRVALLNRILLAGLLALVAAPCLFAEEEGAEAPKEEAKETPKEEAKEAPAAEAPKEAPAAETPAEAPKEEPKAEPAPAPAPAAESATGGAASRYVYVDGKKYTWEEAVLKFPSLKGHAPASVVALEPEAEAPKAQVVKEEAPAHAAPTAEAAQDDAAEANAKAQKEADKAAKEAAEAQKKADEQARKAAEKADKEARKAAEKAQKEAEKAAKNGKPVVPVIVEPDDAQAERNNLLAARKQVALEEEIAMDVRRLMTPGYKEAQARLISYGKPAIPFLIDAMKPEDTTKESFKGRAYQVGTPGRYTDNRTLDEIAYEVLDSMIRNHSTYRGEIPARDVAAWQSFWAANKDSIELGKR